MCMPAPATAPDGGIGLTSVRSTRCAGQHTEDATAAKRTCPIGDTATRPALTLNVGELS